MSEDVLPNVTGDDGIRRESIPVVLVNSDGSIGSLGNIDPRSGYLTVMNEVHGLTHAGKFFFTEINNDSLSDNDTLEYYIEPNNVVTHLRVVGHTSGTSRLEIFEDTTVTAAGTSVTPVNMNRKSSNTANTAVYRDPTVDADGNVIYSTLNPGGRRNRSFGSESGGFEELILDDEKAYLIRLTNLGGGGAEAALALSFYEL